MKNVDDNVKRLSGSALFERTAEAWVPSAAGLGLYISAFRARLLLVVLGYCFALVAIALKSPRLGDALLVAGPALSLVLGVAMATGVLRYARFPRKIAGKRTAVVSFVLLVVSALFSAYAILLALASVGVPVVPASFDAQSGRALTAVWRLPWSELASQVAMLGSLLALLMSFVDAAGSLEAKDVGRRARRAFSAVTLATGLSVALGYFEVQGSLRHDVLVLAGIGVLAVALVAVAMTFGAARYLQAYVTNLGTFRASDAPLTMLAWRNA